MISDLHAPIAELKPHDMKRLLPRPFFLVLAAIAVGFTAALYAMLFAFVPAESSDAHIISSTHFSMTDQTGRRVQDEDFGGKPMLIYFGYSSCPDLCPTQLFMIADTLSQLGSSGKNVQPFFVSIDPERDTPKQLQQYLSKFPGKFVGLTGSAEDVAVMAKEFHVYYAKVANANDPASYRMDHSSMIYLLDGKGRFIKHFSIKNGDSKTFATQLGEALAGLEN